MSADNELEYCRVEVKTGNILEGPKPLPRNWGSVVGFCNLQPRELRRYSWFPVDNSSIPKPYGLMFLPENGKIVKVPHRGVVAGRKEYAISVLRSIADTYATNFFYSDVLSEPFKFSNAYIEQMHRLNCLHTHKTCLCTVRDMNGAFVQVSVPVISLEGLIRDSVVARDGIQQKLHEGLQAILIASDKEIAAMIDTQFVDYFDAI